VRGVVDDGSGGGDDLLVGGVLVSLAVVDTDELKAGVDSRLGRLDTRTVIEVDVHLQVVLGAVVVDQRAHISQADDLGLGVAELDEQGSVLGIGRPSDREERLLVVDVERADREMLCARALHQLPGWLDVAGHWEVQLPFGQRASQAAGRSTTWL
jgi:hypothetical protein